MTRSVGVVHCRVVKKNTIVLAVPSATFLPDHTYCMFEASVWVGFVSFLILPDLILPLFGVTVMSVVLSYSYTKCDDLGFSFYVVLW